MRGKRAIDRQPRGLDRRAIAWRCGLWLAAAGTLSVLSAAPADVPVLAGVTNVAGQCRIIAVAPNPDPPASERPAVFIGPAEGRPERIARPNETILPGNVIHTMKGGSALLELPGGTRLQLAESSQLHIERLRETGSFWLYLKVGAARLLGLASDRTLLQSPAAVATRHQTDFDMRVASDGFTEVTVFEGLVELTNEFGSIRLDGGSVSNRASVATGQAPVQALRATNVVQWWLRFPVVLDLAELPLPAVAARELNESLSHYAQGSYREAVVLYPASRAHAEDAERIYAASLRLLAGDLTGAEALLERVNDPLETARALQLLVATFRRDTLARPAPPKGASAWMALSFWHQSRHELAEARRAAYEAVARSPGFIAARARVVELELGREDLPAARKALAALQRLAPERAITLMLLGFLELAGNRPGPAMATFEDALARDPALAEAWFGLALGLMRQGARARALAAFETAVALEPERSLWRSYLGKALAWNQRSADAFSQIREAVALDPGDPTPWLYWAWLDYERNQINPAIDHLHRSVERNDNLQLFRSRAQLDQDRSMRMTSLARVYERAGMPEVAVREAARAVAYDAANPSAHLFLADSFNLLRDPTRFGLRYETAWFNELLLANALAPVDAGILSPSLSQQEYTRLFARDGLRFASFGEARSDGQYRQWATQSGLFGRSAYAVDLDYQHNDGVRPNQDLDRLELYAQFKQQVTHTDTAFLMLKFEEYESGDNFQYLDSTNARPAYRFSEEQDPIVYSIWRHDWSPRHHTLAAFGRLENQQRFTDEQAGQTVLVRNQAGELLSPQVQPLDVDSRGELAIWTGELNQLAQFEHHTLVAGARVQSGEFESADLLTGNPLRSPVFGDRTGQGVFHRSAITEAFQRMTLYAYDTWHPTDGLALTAGLAWEEMEFPANFRHPPLENASAHRARLLPKLGLVWSPVEAVTFRGMFSQSLGGVSLDESYRLEPVQLAGFSQAFRTVIPESVVGSVSAHDLDLGGAAIDIRLPTRTYAGIQVMVTHSDVDRQIGVFQLDAFSQPLTGGSAQIEERLRYREAAFQSSVHQLVGDDTALGVAYGYSRATLDRARPAAGFDGREEADLHWLRSQGVINLPGGFFAGAGGTWLWQSYDGAARGDEAHLQLDLEAGWRFARQTGQFSVGLLNVLNEDYRLAPLSALPELPRERVLFARLRLNF